MIKPTIWLQARERSAAARERYRRQVLEEVETVLQSLADKYQWDELYLFGSLIAPGRFSSESDIDIAVSGLDKHDLLPFIAEVSRELGSEVDVLRLEESKIADAIRRKGQLWAAKKQSFFF
jgi:predicted nucleotidyltransferase